MQAQLKGKLLSCTVSLVCFWLVILDLHWNPIYPTSAGTEMTPCRVSVNPVYKLSDDFNNSLDFNVNFQWQGYDLN